jgi:hypothetical protein
MFTLVISPSSSTVYSWNKVPRGASDAPTAWAALMPARARTCDELHAAEHLDQPGVVVVERRPGNATRALAELHQRLVGERRAEPVVHVEPGERTDAVRPGHWIVAVDEWLPVRRLEVAVGVAPLADHVAVPRRVEAVDDDPAVGVDRAQPTP